MSENLAAAAQKQGEVWSAAGQNWAELMAPTLTPVWGASLDVARVTRGTRVLDVGCGTGETLALARFRGADVAGVDPAQDFLDIVGDRIPEADLRLGSMEDLPHGDDSFDAVILCNSIMYSDDKERAIREANRVLSPAGRLAVALWAPEEESEFRHVIDALVDLMPEPPSGDGPFALSSPGALETVLESSGFDPDEERYVPSPFTHPGRDHYLQSVIGTGPGQAVSKQVGEEAVTEALLDVGEQFVREDGTYHLDNLFRVVGATPRSA